MQNQTRHSFYLISAFLVTSLLNYAFGVALSWYLEPAQYGVLGVAQSLLLLLALVVGSGFAWTANHDIASLGVTDETRRRFRAAWFTNVLLGIVLAVGLWVIYQANLLPLGRDYRLMVPLISFTIVILASRSVLNGAARGRQRFGHITINLIVEVVIKILVGISLVAMGRGVSGVLLGFAVGALASMIHSYWIIHPDRLWGGKGWMDPQVIQVTIPLFASMLGTALMINLDVLGLKLLAPAGQGDLVSGYYQAAVILARIPVFLAQALTLVMFSHIASGLGSNGAPTHPSVTANHAITVLRSWFRFLAPVGIVLIVSPRTVLAVFFPPQYQLAAVPLTIAASGGVLLALANLTYGVLLAAGHRRQPAVFSGIATSVQIIVLLLLVPRQGISGAALSLVAAGIVLLLGINVWMFLSVNMRNEFLAIVKSVAESPRSMLPLMFLVLALVLIPETNRFSMILKLGMAGIIYLSGLIAINWRSFNFKRPLSNVMLQFVQVLIGV